jgi:hypothetical protein
MRVIAMDSLSPISESFVNFAKTGRVYLLRIKVSPQEAFSKLDGKIGRNKIVSLSDPNLGFGLLVGERLDILRFGTTINLAAVILIIGNKDSTSIYVTSTGGGTYAGFEDYGAHNALLGHVEQTIRKIFTNEPIEREIIAHPDSIIEGLHERLTA